MSKKRFRSKPIEIDAAYFDGDNYSEMSEFTEDKFFHVVVEDRTDDPEIIAEVYDKLHSTWVGVKRGQWIIRGTKGEFYPCDDEVFRLKYEEV